MNNAQLTFTLNLTWGCEFFCLWRHLVAEYLSTPPKFCWGENKQLEEDLPVGAQAKLKQQHWGFVRFVITNAATEFLMPYSPFIPTRPVNPKRPFIPVIPLIPGLPGTPEQRSESGQWTKTFIINHLFFIPHVTRFNSVTVRYSTDTKKNPATHARDLDCTLWVNCSFNNLWQTVPDKKGSFCSRNKQDVFFSKKGKNKDLASLKCSCLPPTSDETNRSWFLALSQIQTGHLKWSTYLEGPCLHGLL